MCTQFGNIFEYAFELAFHTQFAAVRYGMTNRYYAVNWLSVSMATG